MKIEKINKYEELQLEDYQLNQISSPERIEQALTKESCIAFNAYDNDVRIGFALLDQFDEKQFFLWDFIIDSRYQGCGKGKEFLNNIIKKLKEEYSAEVITTTYIDGNEAAKKLYESFGFIQTDTVELENSQEVNMKLII